MIKWHECAPLALSRYVLVVLKCFGASKLHGRDHENDGNDEAEASRKRRRTKIEAAAAAALFSTLFYHNRQTRVSIFPAHNAYNRRQ